MPETNQPGMLAAFPVQDFQLIRIDENETEPVETRLSEPEPVLGFMIRSEYWRYHGPYPITTSGVEEGPRYALIRPDGKIEHRYFENVVVFDSFEAFKQYLRRDAAELYRELAADARKRKDGSDDAAHFAYWAKKLKRIADRMEEDD
jgi:hypothetical protein